jgi:hypothetical protein
VRSSPSFQRSKPAREGSEGHRAILPPQLGAPVEELTGDDLRVGVTVGDALGQDVPDDDQELAGDRDDRLGSLIRRVSYWKAAF